MYLLKISIQHFVKETSFNGIIDHANLLMYECFVKTITGEQNIFVFFNIRFVKPFTGEWWNLVSKYVKYVAQSIAMY